MKPATCPSCNHPLGRESATVICQCGTEVKVRRNGDVGYQIDVKRPSQAGLKIVDGKVKRDGR